MGSISANAIDAEIVPALTENDVSFGQDLPEDEEADGSREDGCGGQNRHGGGQNHQG